MKSPKRDRAQLILMTAVLLAVVLLGLVMISTTAMHTQQQLTTANDREPTNAHALTSTIVSEINTMVKTTNSETNLTERVSTISNALSSVFVELSAQQRAQGATLTYAFSVQPGVSASGTIDGSNDIDLSVSGVDQWVVDIDASSLSQETAENDSVEIVINETPLYVSAAGENKVILHNGTHRLCGQTFDDPVIDVVNGTVNGIDCADDFPVDQSTHGILRIAEMGIRVNQDSGAGVYYEYRVLGTTDEKVADTRFIDLRIQFAVESPTLDYDAVITIEERHD